MNPVEQSPLKHNELITLLNSDDVPQPTKKHYILTIVSFLEEFAKFP